MKVLLCISSLLSIIGCCKDPVQENKNKMLSPVFTEGVSLINNHFNGEVTLKLLSNADTVFKNSINNVIFEPGVRNNWHMHPGGQILLCISGKGHYQERDKEIQIVNPGDVIKIYPGIEHWHGATSDGQFIHLAINPDTEAGETIWLEEVNL